MKKQILMSLILAGSMVTSAQAEEQASQSANTSSVKVSDIQSKQSPKDSQDIDNEITNAKLRAESGSKSKWSMSFDLGYSGGNLQDPLGEVRPNYSGEAALNDVTNLAGDVGVSYRIDPKNRLSLTTGIAVYTPFQSRGEDMLKLQEDGGASAVSTPSVTYGHTTRIGTTQNSFSASYSHATDKYSTDTLNQIGATTLSHTVLLDIAGSNWQPGLSTSVSYNIYNDEAQASDVIGGKGSRPDYGIGLYPFAEYAFNDTFSFRTVFRPATYNHMRSDEALTFKKSMYTQSLGVGIAVTRDIYLYPNMQFAPENLKPELTNVGMNATLNVF